MSDLISRKDAIEAVEDTDWYHQNKKGEMVHGANPSDHQAWYKAEDIYNVLESLPSAEPKTPSNGSITSINPENTHDRTMGDLISRQEAVDAILGLTNCDTVDELRAYVKGYDLGSWWSGGVLSSVGKVERLPSAEKTQLPEEDATSGCKCPCVYREPCDVCHYDGHLGLGCPAEEGLRDE